MHACTCTGTQNSYCVGVGTIMMGIGGTSAACPVVAGIFARLNALRLGKGSAPLGFLNPWIYKNAAAFQDAISPDLALTSSGLV